MRGRASDLAKGEGWDKAISVLTILRGWQGMRFLTTEGLSLQHVR
jgi:hypothetical protein